MRLSLQFVGWSLAAFAGVACSSSSTTLVEEHSGGSSSVNSATGGNSKAATSTGGKTAATGGSSSTVKGGQSATGGTSSTSPVTTGGAASVGGGSSTGGSNSGTIVSTGGAPSTGGASTMGGATATGGGTTTNVTLTGGAAPTAGGAVSTGGAAPTAGGAVATGGAAPATGGAPPATGGAASTAGGAVATGGAVSTGGAAPTAGGAAATGGAPPATGGAPPATGGAAPATGGAAPATGGAPPTGGVPATGGTGATGGSSSPATTAPPPSITSIGPTSGIVTTLIGIDGQNFGATQGASTVKINGAEVVPTYWSATRLELKIPMALNPGSATVTVTVGGAQSNSATFEVLLPRRIYINQGLSPNNGVAAFSLESSGVMAEQPGSPFTTGDMLSNSSLADKNSLAFCRSTRKLFAMSDATVQVFDIDPINGKLTAVGTKVSTGVTGQKLTNGIVVNSSCTFVYVTSSPSDYPPSTDSVVSAFAVSSSGTLAPITGSPFPVDSLNIGAPALLHNDQLLVVNDRNWHGPDFNLLFVNTVNASTGALTPIADPPYATGLDGAAARSDPSGTYYYKGSQWGQVMGYSFFSTGAPLPLWTDPLDTGTGILSGIAFTPNGKYMYIGNTPEIGATVANKLSAFSVSSGVLTPLSGSPFTIEGLSVISSLAVSRNGSLLVMVDGTTQQMVEYSIGADGKITRGGGGGTYPGVGTAAGIVIAE